MIVFAHRPRKSTQGRSRTRLSTVAILPLAQQYLAYVDTVENLRLDVAGDYQNEEWSDTAAMADALRFQLLRREAIKKAADELHRRPQLGFDFFLRGMRDESVVEDEPVCEITMEDLLKAFRSGKRGSEPSHYVVVVNRFFSIEATAARLRARLGDAATAMLGWGTLRDFLPEGLEQEPQLTRRSAIASTLAASLQLVKSGELELQQDGSFGPISIRRCQVRTASIGSG